MAEYVARPGASISDQDATIIGRALEDIEQRKAGITPHDVVEEARPDDAALHNYFEWEDSVAAEEYRRTQARYLIRAVLVVREEGDEPIPTWHNVIQTIPGDGTERVYRRIDIVAQQSDLLEQVIERELRQLEGVQRRLSQYEELRPVAQGSLALALVELQQAAR